MNKSTTSIKTFTDLIAWQKSHELALSIYEATRCFPSDERFALTDQLRRAAVSVTSNIAEGFSRNTPKDKAQYYTIAIGSLYEIQSQLILAKDLKYLDLENYDKLLVQATNAAKLCNRLKSSAYQLNIFIPKN